MRLTVDQRRECLDVLGWSQRQLSAMLSCDESSVRQWFRDARLPPIEVDDWLDQLAAAHRAIGLLPTGWRNNRDDDAMPSAGPIPGFSR